MQKYEAAFVAGKLKMSKFQKGFKDLTTAKVYSLLKNVAPIQYCLLPDKFFQVLSVLYRLF